MTTIVKIIEETEELVSTLERASKTISRKDTKNKVESWVKKYWNILAKLLSQEPAGKAPLDYVHKNYINKRLKRKDWLRSVNKILGFLKKLSLFNTAFDIAGNEIFSSALLEEIKPIDKKIHTLAEECNYNWNIQKCPNSCGILMRIILERILDMKDVAIKEKEGLKAKVNHCLNNKVFGKSVTEALKKLDASTKITGDIVAHDSNILLGNEDVELSIIPLRILCKEVLKK